MGLLGAHEEQYRAQRQTVNPVYQEVRSLPMTTDTDTLLKIEIWDQDFDQEDDFMGEVTIPLASIFADHKDSGLDLPAGAEWAAAGAGGAWLVPRLQPTFYPLEDPEGRVMAQMGNRRNMSANPHGSIQLSFKYMIDEARRKPPPGHGPVTVTLFELEFHY